MSEAFFFHFPDQVPALISGPEPELVQKQSRSSTWTYTTVTGTNLSLGRGEIERNIANLAAQCCSVEVVFLQCPSIDGDVSIPEDLMA